LPFPPVGGGVSAIREFKPGFAGCLIGFELPMTECEAYTRMLLRLPIEATDRMLVENYGAVPTFL
jgi:hypothetical protein